MKNITTQTLLPGQTKTVPLSDNPVSQTSLQCLFRTFAPQRKCTSLQGPALHFLTASLRSRCRASSLKYTFSTHKL